MLLKMTGIIFIIAAGSMFGFSLSRDYTMRITNLKQVNKMLLLLKGEISYNNSGIGEAVIKISSQTDNIIGRFLGYVSEAFASGENTFREAWDRGVDEFLKKQSKLKDKDLAVIRELGSNLGITDRETQVNNILNCMGVLETEIGELNETRGEKCKLYRTLGVMAGAFVAIVLI